MDLMDLDLIKDFNHRVWKFKSDNKLGKKAQIKVFIHGSVLFALLPYMKDLIMTHHIIELHASPEYDYKFEVYNDK